MNKSNPSVQQEQKIALFKTYLQISEEYAHGCRQMVRTLEEFQYAHPEDSVMVDLRTSSERSLGLANEISRMLKAVVDRSGSEWLEEFDVDYGIDVFVQLSQQYLEMRKGFIDLLTDPRSGLRNRISSSDEGQELSTKQKENRIMAYMKERRTSKGVRKWSNEKIGKFFDFKANSVVNRLNSSKTQPSSVLDLADLILFLEKNGFNVPSPTTNDPLLHVVSEDRTTFTLIYIGEPSTKLENRHHAHNILKNGSDRQTVIAMLYKREFLFIPGDYFSRVSKMIIGSTRKNDAAISTTFVEVLEDIRGKYSDDRNAFGLEQLLKNL